MPLKPSNIILDLLRTYGSKGTQVQSIMATGKMFGCTDNQIRVSLSRLVAKGTIENHQRGHYRLGQASDPINDFVERWRLGEDRLKPWDQKSWLIAHSASTLEPHGEWALRNNGFKQVSGLWIRPDNVNQPNTKATLISLGWPSEGTFIPRAELDSKTSEQWFQQFDTEFLDRGYESACDQLTQSLKQLPRLPQEVAKRESFHLGGMAIQLLAKDPLIPYQKHPATGRKKLSRLMLEYDRAGRQVWAYSNTELPGAIPTARIDAA